jgi:hypothetical protein
MGTILVKWRSASLGAVRNCYDNATYALFYFLLSISCLVTDHLMSHVTAGQVILTMTHRLKAFTLDAGLRITAHESW